MAEYRLDELARISGVSARNIRAYRERGLLDAPRRVGRSAVYDDYHLSQLRTINQLHKRGFSSAHIAEFFTSLRQGADLADILGIQRAVLGHRTESDDIGESADAAALAIAVDSDEGGRLIASGLAEVIDGSVVLTDPAVRQVLARAADQRIYVRALLRILEATSDAIDGLAGGFVRALDECVAATFGEDYAANPGHLQELDEVVRDFRQLWNRVISGRLDEALQQRIAASESDHIAGILLSGSRESPES